MSSNAHRRVRALCPAGRVIERDVAFEGGVSTVSPFCA
jgi:hypothetical protein